MSALSPSRAIHAVVALGSVASVCSPSKGARADSSPTSSLSWVDLPGAEDCGGAPAIARAVEERLGRHVLVSPAQADFSIEGRAERSGHPPLWRAVVVLRGQDGAVHGSRELGSAANDCSELRASVALAAALMIDPQGPAPPPPPIVIQRVETPAAAVTEPAPPWRAEPSASFALGFGVLPSMAAGVRVGLALTPSRLWTFEAFGGAWGAQTLQPEQGAQVRFSLPYAGLAVCPLSFGVRGHPTFSVCAGTEVGFLGTTSQGFSETHSSLDPTWRFVAPARLSFPIAGGLALRLGAELGVALLRDHFVYEDAGKATRVVSDPPLVAAQCDLGLSLSLP